MTKLSVPGTVWIYTYASARGVGWRAKKIQWAGTLQCRYGLEWNTILRIEFALSHDVPSARHRILRTRSRPPTARCVPADATLPRAARDSEAAHGQIREK